MQLNAGVCAFVKLLSYALAHHRELELVRLNGALHFRVLQTRLDHLTFIRLEDKSLTLEIIDISLVHALAIHEAELNEDKQP